MQKATRERTKQHNTQLVLRTIYNNGDISRADIARATELTPPTVSALVAELLERNFIIETGQGPSAGGKPPTLLDIAGDAHHLLCLDLGDEIFRGAIVNLRGEILERARFPVARHSSDWALEQLYALIDTLLEQSTAPLLGIAVGTPGLIDPREGFVRRAVNLAWENLPLRQRLEARYEKPVYVANDSHMAALAEYVYGGARESNNLIVIKVEQGIGAGIVLDGRILHGDGLGAGEIGHLVVVEGGEPCTCGNFGCLETIASTRALLRRAQRIASLQPASPLALAGPLTLDAIREVAEAGDEATRALLAEAGRGLGITIASLIVGFNIHRVVLAGSVTQLGEVVVAAARDAARRRALRTLAEQTTVEVSTLGDDIVILGCAAMILHQELGII
ncbi:MAG: ROK family transcriptional regulator [Ardenticatenaceae bacterium]